MKYGPPKGTKDFLPEDQLIRQKIIDTCKEVFDLYGFAPMDTPGFEMLEVLTSKGAGGSEIGKEIYKLKDRGGRSLGLRFDLTVPTARVLSKQKQIRLPFKRYAMGKVWRQEFGTRMREFWQCDADTIGAATPTADVEPFLMIREVFSRLDLPIKIIYNSRKILNKVCDEANIPKSKQMQVILILDKLDKIGESGVKKELARINVNGSVVKKFLSAKVIDDPQLTEVYGLLKRLGVKEAIFDPTLSRGLDYYTGLIFEVKTPKYPSSIASGGRYDKLLSKFGDVDQPAVGVSFGIDRIFEILKKTVKPTSSSAQIYVIPVGLSFGALQIAEQLRSEGVNVSYDLLGRSIGKNLDYANKMGIPFALIVGEKELKSKKFVLKELKSGREQILNIKQVSSKLKA